MGIHKAWKGFIQFGLLNIPVAITTCARDKRISMNTFHVTCKGPVKMPKWCPACQVQLQPIEIFRGYDTGKGIVQISDEELDSITPETGRTVEILECVKWEQLDPLLLAESFYVLPEDAGAKGYGLLAKVLRDENLVALAQITKNGREHVIALRPKDRGLMMHYLYYEGEVNRVPEFESLAVISLTTNEIKLGTQLAQSLVADFDHSKFEDSYSQRLNTLIASKLDKTIDAPEPIKAINKIASIDIMGVLEASLASAKKSPKRSVQQAEAPAKVKGKKRKAA